MKRKELFKEILKAIYERTSVSEDVKNNKIYFENGIFNKCAYSTQNRSRVIALFEMTFVKKDVIFETGVSQRKREYEPHYTREDAIVRALNLFDKWGIKNTEKLHFDSSDFRSDEVGKYIFKAFKQYIFNFLFYVKDYSIYPKRSDSGNDDITDDFNKALPKIQQIIDKAYNKLVRNTNNNGITNNIEKASYSLPQNSNVNTYNECNKMDEEEQPKFEPNYEQRRLAFIQYIMNNYNQKTINDSEMDLFYKCSKLRQYVDIKDYADKNSIDIIDLNTMNIKEFKSSEIYMFRGECSFECDNNWVIVHTNINGHAYDFTTSENNWVNWSFVVNYVKKNIPRRCICYFIYDQGKILQVLQIDDG